MIIRKISIIVFSILLGVNLGVAQTPESCDCVVDTTGLKAYLQTVTLNENQPLAFEVPNANSTFAVLHGFINSNTPTTVNTFISNYPNVTTLVFMQVPGSEDDDANLVASQALRNRGYKHYIPAVNAYAQDAFIASGGVDMFVGGTVRVADVGAEVGVHSWGDGTNDATDFPVGHANHLPYINYYVNMGFTQQEAEAFYYFTINAAPASGIHNMTEAELEQYGTRTCTYSNMPVYTVTQNGNMLEANLQGASYQWIDCANNSPITGETGRVYTADQNGRYAVIVTENACSDTSDCLTINSVGSEELNRTQFLVYPNPTKDVIQISGIRETAQVDILSASGQSIKRIMLNANESIDVETLPKGVYLVRIEDSNSQLITKMVKL
jgi:hypothetical protein